MASIVGSMTQDTKPPSRTADQFVVRLPEGMRDRIAEEAKKNNRSMNAEIVARLEASLHVAPLSGMPLAIVADAISQLDGYARERKITTEEALSGLVASALNKSDLPLFFFVIDKEMTMGRIREMFEAASDYLPDNAPMHFQARGLSNTPPPTGSSAPLVLPTEPTPYSEYAKSVIEDGREAAKPAKKVIRRKRPEQK